MNARLGKVLGPSLTIEARLVDKPQKLEGKPIYLGDACSKAKVGAGKEQPKMLEKLKKLYRSAELEPDGIKLRRVKTRQVLCVTVKDMKPAQWAKVKKLGSIKATLTDRKGLWVITYDPAAMQPQ